MKIDKLNPFHWILLTIFSINIILCLLLTIFRKPVRIRVVLYGHKLNGNLKALHDYYQEHPGHEVFFLALDPSYSRDLRKSGISALNVINPLDIYTVCQSRVIVTDHGPLSLMLLIWLNKYVFIDVWHGIPFKGFDAQDFRAHHPYDYTLVTSDLLKKFYIDKFGFRDEQVIVTGYGRTDQLVCARMNPVTLKRKYGLDGNDRKIVM
ncbi:CDP-glycerol glycerophosphotransferase family protein, partial [Kaarinaea lacus]